MDKAETELTEIEVYSVLHHEIVEATGIPSNRLYFTIPSFFSYEIQLLRQQSASLIQKLCLSRSPVRNARTSSIMRKEPSLSVKAEDKTGKPESSPADQMQ